MKTYRQFLEAFYHSSSEPIKKVGDRPMWFSTNKKHAEGWKDRAEKSGKKSHDYVADMDCKVVDLTKTKLPDHTAKEVKAYQTAMAENPKKTAVLQHALTKAIKKLGYDGVKHADYDPTTFKKNTDGKSALIFHPEKKVKLKST